MAKGFFQPFRIFFLSLTDIVYNWGVLFDLKFRFTSQVNSVIKSCFANLRDTHFLSYDVSVVVANALVSKRLLQFSVS